MTQPSPTPQEIDAQAKKYVELQEKTMEAKLALRDCEQQLSLQADLVRGLVDKYGGAHAEKSKILYGLKFEAMCSYGQTVKIDPAAVENFRLKLVEADKPRLLRQMFEKRVSWLLNPQASTIIRSEKLPDELAAEWAKCEIIQAKTPILKVREKSA